MDFRMLHFGMTLCMYALVQILVIAYLDIGSCTIQPCPELACLFYIVSSGIRFSNSFVAVHPSSMSCK